MIMGGPGRLMDFSVRSQKAMPLGASIRSGVYDYSTVHDLNE